MCAGAVAKSLIGIALGLLLPLNLLAQPAAQPAALPIQANTNRIAAGKLDHGVLTVHLELKQADWYPEADDGPSMKVYAFGEEGKAPQIPGPMIRVPQGTEIRVTLHNLLSATALVHGMHRRPGDVNDVVEVPPGETREVNFTTGAPGTYEDRASAGGPTFRGRAYREDSQLSGALVVDPPGVTAPDRVFVIGAWRSQESPILSQDVAVINGKSWPYTERLTYAAGETVRWRWINASSLFHPMHLHGSYYRVDSAGDSERDEIFDPAHQQMLVTHVLSPSETMATTWIPLAGRWIFHCHIVAHFSPEMNVANALRAQKERLHEHGAEHMAGLVLGINVTGERAPIVSHGTPQRLQVLAEERPASDGLPAGFGYQAKEPGMEFPDHATAPGPPLILERGRPVEITVVNQLREPTAVHWHGMELESYYDGVVGWGAGGGSVTPMIAPGDSFNVRFTPPRAGTFMYHTHLNDGAQLAGGLYGALVVMEPAVHFDPATDHIFVIGISSPDEFKAQRLINGSADPPTLHWRKGEVHRLRLINITANNVGVVSLIGETGLSHWRAIAKDGADLPPAQALTKDARQPIWVGETYDFEYQSDKAESLRLEVETPPGAASHWKVSQRVDVE